jgi:hypothetical protein
MPDKVVDVKELEKLKKDIDDVITKKSITVTTEQLQVRGYDQEIDEKDKVIYEYIKNNLGINKTQVVKFFEKNKVPGYSRVPVLSAINRLEKEYGMIIIRLDKTNRRIQHLFINHESALVSLLTDLDSFKQVYYMLIDKINTFLNNKNIIFTGFIGLVKYSKLVNALLVPFKFVLIPFNIFNLFLPYEKVEDKEMLHKKFSLIYGTVRDLQTMLYETFFKESHFRSNDSRYTYNFMYDQLGFLTNVLHSSLWGSNHENIEEMLITLNEYELLDSAKIVLDHLWKIIHPIFRIIYPRFYRDNEEKFKDWREFIVNYHDFDPTAQVSTYSKVATQMAFMSSKI